MVIYSDFWSEIIRYVKGVIENFQKGKIVMYHDDSTPVLRFLIETVHIPITTLVIPVKSH